MRELLDSVVRDQRLLCTLSTWGAALCALLAYELAVEYVLFSVGGPVGPHFWVMTADLARMAGGAWVLIGRYLLMPWAVLALLVGRWMFGRWSSRALLAAVTVPVLALSWRGVPDVAKRYQREQLEAIMPIAARVSQEFEQNGKLLTLHGGLRGTGTFRLLEDGTLWLYLPSHLCSSASLRWSNRLPQGNEACFWSSQGWVFHCN